MYAQIYVFILQIVIFNYVSTSNQFDSTAVNKFPFSVKNTRSSNSLKQRHDISNYDEGNNPDHKSNQSHVYTADEMELAERGITDFVLNILPGTNCIHTAAAGLFEIAKDSVECFVSEMELSHLENEINKELNGEKETMEKEFKTLDTGGFTFKKVITSVLDLPKNVYNFIYNKIENYFVKKFMKRFITKRNCKSKILEKIKKNIFTKLFHLGICVFMTSVMFGK